MWCFYDHVNVENLLQQVAHAVHQQQSDLVVKGRQNRNTTMVKVSQRENLLFNREAVLYKDTVTDMAPKHFLMKDQLCPGAPKSLGKRKREGF